LKNTDDFLEKAVITGILRIAGAGLFSGANNVSVYTVLDERFSQYFGFTEEEVKEILADMEREGIVGASARFPEVSHWYNGYQFGKEIIYNPWSTMKCFSNKFSFRSYWLNTGSDSLLRERFIRVSDALRLEVDKLIKREAVTITLSEDLRFDDALDEDKHFWTLLLAAGYLKSVNTRYSDEQVTCGVEIPNKEVRAAYLQLFVYWMQQILPRGENQILVERLLTGEAEKFGQGLRRMLLECASVRDMRSDYIEAFYKGFLIATIGLSLGSHADLKSERESGLGYSDLVLRPIDLSNPKYQVGIVLELKRTDRSAELKIKAQEGLDQIKEKRYATDFRACGISKIMIMGLAFCGKELEYVHEMLTVPENTPSVTALTRFGILRPRSVDGNEAPEEPETKRAKLE